MAKEFILGAKVALSEKGANLCYRKNPYKTGHLILNVKTRSKNCVTVLWENSKTPSILHESFIVETK
jgi:hypothetical protein